MIETYVFVGMMVGWVAVIGVVVGCVLWLRSELKAELAGLKSDVGADISGLKSGVGSDTSGLKSHIRAIDESQRRMENDLAFIKGALMVVLPRLTGWRQPGLDE